MNNKMTEIKKYIRGNQQHNVAEEWLSDLEDRMMEITETEQNKEKRMKKNEDSLRDLWANIKYTNIQIIGVPDGEKKGMRKYLRRLELKIYLT